MSHGAAGSLGSMFIALILVPIAVVYMLGWFRIRSDRREGISARRSGCFLAGLLLIWVATASSIAALDQHFLTIHMIQHLFLMTFAPPLIWLGEPLRAVSEGLPQRVRPLVVKAFKRTSVRQLWITITRPKFSLLAASMALIGWHIPALFMLGMHSNTWHALEQVSFLATGLLFWWPVVHPWPSVGKQDFSIIVYLFLATLPCDILSAFLVFCDRVVYPVYASVPNPLGLTALQNQQCAGALMWTSVTVVYLAVGAMLSMHLLSPARSS